MVLVDILEGDAGVVQFPNRPAEQVAENLEPADSPVSYTGAEGFCGLSGGEVSGPNGQVNHGMFMKLFNSLYDGRGRGCVVRHLAQSDLGKGDQQVQANDTTPFESVEAGDTGTVDFTTTEADCEHGRKADEQGGGAELEARGGNGSNGKPDHAGKPENTGSAGSQGNSGSAPGHNK